MDNSPAQCSSRKNAMTVDVEDYFQVAAFEGAISKKQWDTLPTRVERNTDRILEIFQRNDIHATFFVLGWIATRFPQLTRRIVDNGHELASHGTDHTRVTRQSAAEFLNDIVQSKKLLEDIGGCEVRGYRAATYSIDSSNLWAFDLLREAGYSYSSSIYPIKHDLYGMPDAPRFRFSPCERFTEIPVSTVRLLGRNWPCGGGGYFRLLPYFLSRWAIRHLNEEEGEPCVFYFHPWEIDPNQPRPPNLQLKARFRHYLNLRKMVPRLESLAREFRWDRMDKIFMDA